jgi:1-acyl-sn-glycerol-3-phosphate acyltransferase
LRHYTLAILRGFFLVLFSLLTRLSVVGNENFSKIGGYIVAANHLSVLEVVLVYCLIRRDDATGLVAKNHQKSFLFRSFVNIIHGIWLNRDEPDSQAFRSTIKHLKNGGVIGLSPEGTRSPTGALIPAKNGVALLADMAKVPIVPVGIAGTWKITKQILTLKRPRITVHIGKPFILPAIDRKNRDEGLQNNTDEIMCQIAALLPPDLRGVYADYPRVHELTA